MKRSSLIRPVVAALTLWQLLCLAAVGQVNRKHVDTELAPFPKEVQQSAIVSPDGRHIAYIRQADGRQIAVRDGKPQQPYDKITALQISPDSKSLAYAAASGGVWRVVVDGLEQPPQARVGSPVFSPDGRRLAYIAQQPDQGRVVVVEGRPGKVYDRIFDGLLVFSPDGRRLAYGGMSADGWHLVVDGQEGPAYEYFGSSTGIQFSPDGQRVVFAAKTGKAWSIMAGDQKLGPYDDTGDFVFSADGKRTAYAVMKAGKWLVIVDGQEQKPYDAVAQGMLAFSPDGQRVAYAAQSGQKWLMVDNQREGKPYDSILDMLFSPNGKFLAYIVKTTIDSNAAAKPGSAAGASAAANPTKVEMVIINNREQPAFDRVGGGTMVFTRNSQRLGYIARTGRGARAVVGQVEIEKKEGKPALRAGARKRRYELVGYLNFSPDNDHFVYAATDQEKTYTVVDEQEAAHRYDAIWNVRGQKLIFDGYKKFHYMGVKGDKIYLVEEELN